MPDQRVGCLSSKKWCSGLGCCRGDQIVIHFLKNFQVQGVAIMRDSIYTSLLSEIISLLLHCTAYRKVVNRVRTLLRI